MNLNSTRYTFLFAVIVCVVCGVLLSAVSEGFRKQQELNAALDIKKNILKAVILRAPIPAKTLPAEVLKVYNSKIEEFVIDGEGNIVEGKKPEDIQGTDTDLHPLYVYKEDSQVMAYAIPVVGQGLWSTLYGYLALEADAITIRGITFYKHGETPGLGGEIEKDWFQNNFKGKTIWSVKKQKLTPPVVVKGKVKDLFHDEAEAAYHVDGITAATITGSGVTAMMDHILNIYEPYFSKMRKS